jgi:L-aspartate oxidase
MNADFDALAGRPVIIGGGLAGLMTALRLAPHPVVLLSKAPLGEEASTPWAQGGLAASLGHDDDPALHLADTLGAGDGLCDPEASDRILRAAPAAIDALVRLGAAFDRTTDGALSLGLEAAHSRRRIVRAAGDGAGRELMRVLVETVRSTPSITIIERAEARRLLVEDNTITGVLAAGPAGPFVLATRRIVLATGGIGGLFLDSTNPQGCFGQGLALAARAGAELGDLEFIQFHPTALDGRERPMKLISEAVRGEGAVLVDENGLRFLAGQPGAELAPRDVVARGLWRHLAGNHQVFLDAREKPGADFGRRFPAIAGFCRAAGIDPATQPIPVRPAAHYHMGGVAVDGAGRSSIAGLWACGEVACTGLHGANRLASNSLTEAVVCAGWVAESVAGAEAGRARTPVPVILPPAPDPTLVRPIMSRSAGLMRHLEELQEAARALLALVSGHTAASDPAAVGLMIVVMALRREESRGAHSRTDFPQRDAVARRATLGFVDAIAAAREIGRHTSSTASRAQA